MSFEIHTQRLFETADFPDFKSADVKQQRAQSTDHPSWPFVSMLVAMAIVIGLAIVAAAQSTTISAASEPAPTQLSRPDPGSNGVPFPQVPGATLKKLDRSDASPPRPDAVVVKSVAPDSAAALQGLRHGDVIVAANRRPVHSVPELIAIADGAHGVLVLDVLRGDTPLVVLIP